MSDLITIPSLVCCLLEDDSPKCATRRTDNVYIRVVTDDAQTKCASSHHIVLVDLADACCACAQLHLLSMCKRASYPVVGDGFQGVYHTLSVPNAVVGMSLQPILYITIAHNSIESDISM